MTGVQTCALPICRFATYKRAHLLFTDLDRLAKIVNNPDYPVQFLFTGKAHPHDGAGQGLIKRIIEISRRPEFLGNIRECDAIIHVLRCFDNGNIVHVDGSVNPVRDKEIIDTELQLKDLETVENRIKRVEKIAKVGGDKAAKIEYELLDRKSTRLNSSHPSSSRMPSSA